MPSQTTSDQVDTPKPVGSSRAKPEDTQSAPALIGCLIDVSGSMQKTFESGQGDERAVDRFRAVLRATLKLAKAEQKHDTDALMFVGCFGMANNETPVVDLCGLLENLLELGEGCDGAGIPGRDSLIVLANEEGVPHVSHYIREWLTEVEARVLANYLRKCPEVIKDFVGTIPNKEDLHEMDMARSVGQAFASWPTDLVSRFKINNSHAMKFVHRVCDEFFHEHATFVARPVSKVVKLLEELHDHPSLTPGEGHGRTTFAEELVPHIYGWTTMRAALETSLALFDQHKTIKQRILVLISDGESTDGNPLDLAEILKGHGIILATIFLTSDRELAGRRLYDHDSDRSRWTPGRAMLLNMASPVSSMIHPIPVLLAMGWQIPSSGECALFVDVCSSEVLEEFCSLLLSASFGSVDAILDFVGKVDLDAIINDVHVRTCRDPSDQEESGTCYAHATASVLHMALSRIHARERSNDNLREIREAILKQFKAQEGGHDVVKVMKYAIKHYPPLHFCQVDEDGARQAVLRRRPVLATFRLSRPGWAAFSEHFENAITRSIPLAFEEMRPYSLSHVPSAREDGGGHAVVMTGCSPSSLTFLNSWGHGWGNNGSFTIESPATLELSSKVDWAKMTFYDVFWYESELTPGERRAFQEQSDRIIRAHAQQHKGLRDLEARCPLCRKNTPIAGFIGNIYEAVCPKCQNAFKPETEDLLQALYARAAMSSS